MNFQILKPKITNNPCIRPPQREAYEALVKFATTNHEEREVGLILPVGCGKSGCITLTPFAFKSKRALIVAPGLNIFNQLAKDFDPANSEMFYRKCKILTGTSFPEPATIEGSNTNRSDLDDADVVVTNIQQLQGGEANRWLKQLPNDFFDVIVFDEGHHSVAETWEFLKNQFPKAAIVNYSATPLRADGRLMSGTFIYSYPIFRAIAEGYVKRLKAVQLNPKTLKFLRHENGQDIEIELDEVIRRGEEDSEFRRGILTSNETLTTIVDASIRELEKLRTANNENRLKIIASALNYGHCIQIVEAYRERGLRADYVHSQEDSKINERVIESLNNHELDAIVQVRKLGEGFDHPYLSVAAVFSVFNNLSPFVQFIGRIMRVIKPSSPDDPINQGVVVYHAGANVARRWSDFQQYSEADQDFFDQLFPVEFVDPNMPDREINPARRNLPHRVIVSEQTDVKLQEIPLLSSEIENAISLLREAGIIQGEFDPQKDTLERVPVTKQRQRQAKRSSLDEKALNSAMKILAIRSINPHGYELDKKRLNRTNLICMKSCIDKNINRFVGKSSGQRSEFSREDLTKIEQCYATEILPNAVKEMFSE